MTTITLPRAVVQQALDALEQTRAPQRWPFAVKQDSSQAINALRAALEQPLPGADWTVDMKRRLDAALEQPQPSPAPAQPEPIARVTGYFGGRAAVAALDPAAVLPAGMALYAAPIPAPAQADHAALLREAREALRECANQSIGDDWTAGQAMAFVKQRARAVAIQIDALLPRSEKGQG